MVTVVFSTLGSNSVKHIIPIICSVLHVPMFFSCLRHWPTKLKHCHVGFSAQWGLDTLVDLANRNLHKFDKAKGARSALGAE